MFVFCRPRLLTVITHGRLSQEMREQLKSLSARDVLAIETACSTSILSHDELPWKRCSSLTREVYTYPEVLKVHVIAICTLGMQILFDDPLPIHIHSLLSSVYWYQVLGTVTLTSLTC